MSKQIKNISAVALLTLVVFVIAGCSNNQQTKNKSQVKIGVVTDLTGPAAYWGESTQVGAEIAKKELSKEGIDVNLSYEDYQLDAAKALTGAQKLIDVDNVDAVYAEFNPAAISVGSFMKGKNKLYMYDAAVTSPMIGNANAYKTYLDYQAGCHAVAQKFKDQGIAKIGMIKPNIEFGELCLAGVKEVYADATITEGYNLGDADVKTQMTKLKSQKVGAVINVGFEGDTLNALKAIKELGMKTPFGTVDDTITDNVKQKYGNELKGAWTFGFATVDPAFSAKIKAETSKKLATEYGAAITYTHVKQVARAMAKCNKDSSCVNKQLDQAVPDKTIGFNKFVNHVADLSMSIRQY